MTLIWPLPNSDISKVDTVSQKTVGNTAGGGSSPCVPTISKKFSNARRNNPAVSDPRVKAILRRKNLHSLRDFPKFRNHLHHANPYARGGSNKSNIFIGHFHLSGYSGLLTLISIGFFIASASLRVTVLYMPPRPKHVIQAGTKATRS